MGVVFALVAGCATGDDESDDAASETPILVDTNLHETEGTLDEFSDADPEDAISFDVPVLETESLEADLPGESRIWPLSETWVGQLDDDLFIAISLDEDYLGEQYDVLAYLCDGADTMVVHAGQLDDGRATLSGEIVDVDFAMVNEDISGTVSFDGESFEFSAAPAAGPAGLYVAEYSSNGDLATAMWIVNDAGEQRGSIRDIPCIPVPRIGCIPLWTDQR